MNTLVRPVVPVRAAPGVAGRAPVGAGVVAAGVVHEDHPFGGRDTDRARAGRVVPCSAGLQARGPADAAIGRFARVVEVARRRVGPRLPGAVVPVAAPGDVHLAEVEAVAALAPHPILAGRTGATGAKAAAGGAPAPVVLAPAVGAVPVPGSRGRCVLLRLAAPGRATEGVEASSIAAAAGARRGRAAIAPAVGSTARVPGADPPAAAAPDGVAGAAGRKPALGAVLVLAAEAAAAEVEAQVARVRPPVTPVWRGRLLVTHIARQPFSPAPSLPGRAATPRASTPARARTAAGASGAAAGGAAAFGRARRVLCGERVLPMIPAVPYSKSERDSSWVTRGRVGRRVRRTPGGASTRWSTGFGSRRGAWTKTGTSSTCQSCGARSKGGTARRWSCEN